jgi:hypothetical protein
VREIVLSKMYVTISRSADVAGEMISEFFELPAAILAVTCIGVANRVSCGNVKSHNQLKGQPEFKVWREVIESILCSSSRHRRRADSWQRLFGIERSLKNDSGALPNQISCQFFSTDQGWSCPYG